MVKIGGRGKHTEAEGRKIRKALSCKISVKCSNCGEVLFRKPGMIEKIKHCFCNQVCKAEWQNKFLRKDKNPRWQGGPVSVKCANCGKIVLRKRNEVKGRCVFFCTLKCFGAWRKVNWIGPKCPNYKERIAVKCVNCGQTLYKCPSAVKESGRRFFCNRRCKERCQAREFVGAGNHNWRGGKGSESYPLEFTRQLKELIRSRDEYKCQKCGCPEIENGQKLIVHHIDYNKKNCLPSNLISLCRSCNAQVNFDREKWETYFENKIKMMENQGRLRIRRPRRRERQGQAFQPGR